MTYKKNCPFKFSQFFKCLKINESINVLLMKASTFYSVLSFIILNFLCMYMYIEKFTGVVIK